MSGIGDVMWSTPLLANLKLAYPDARIGYVVRSKCALALENNPHVDSIHLFEEESISYQLGFLRRLRKERYELTIDIICSPATAIQSVVSGAKDRIGFDFRGRRHLYNHVLSKAEANRGHEVEFDLAVLDYMEIPRRHTEMVWIVSEEETAHAQRSLRAMGVEPGAICVALVPTGGYQSKKWFPEYYAETARSLVESHGIHALVFWGNDVEERDAHTIEKLGGRNVHAVPEQNLRHAAAMLNECSVVIGNDTGPLHLSCALGCRVIALYGRSDPKAQGPWGDNVIVLRAPNVDEICCKRLTCIEPTHACMRQLVPEMVIDEARRSLDVITGAH